MFTVRPSVRARARRTRAGARTGAHMVRAPPPCSRRSAVYSSLDGHVHFIQTCRVWAAPKSSFSVVNDSRRLPLELPIAAMCPARPTVSSRSGAHRSPCCSHRWFCRCSAAVLPMLSRCSPDALPPFIHSSLRSLPRLHANAAAPHIRDYARRYARRGARYTVASCMRRAQAQAGERGACKRRCVACTH